MFRGFQLGGFPLIFQQVPRMIGIVVMIAPLLDSLASRIGGRFSSKCRTLSHCSGSELIDKFIITFLLFSPHPFANAFWIKGVEPRKHPRASSSSLFRPCKKLKILFFSSILLLGYSLPGNANYCHKTDPSLAIAPLECWSILSPSSILV